MTIVLENAEILSGVCGANDENLKLIESALGGKVAARGNELYFDDAPHNVDLLFKDVIDRIAQIVRQGEEASPDYIKTIIEGLSDPETRSQEAMFQDSVIKVPHGFTPVFPRGVNQVKYIQAIRRHDIVFCVGPAGTGKTFLAVAEALKDVLSKRRRKLVLTRPVVEAGESLGFLPGDLAQKINPYLRPLYDAMETILPYETIRRLDEARTIEIAPLAYMRGRSLNDCVIILDEAQNTTKEQMKMFLTRIGEGSKAIITGDVTQVDLPRRMESGLLHAIKLLTDVEGVNISYLNTKDVVRNPLIKKIINAYERETE